MAEAKKVTVEIVSGEKKEKKDKSGFYYIYKDIQGVQFLSNDELKEGLQEVYMTETEKEYNGKKSITRWITKEEHKPKGKDGKFFPKQPDKVAILKESMIMAEYWIAHGFSTKPKSKDELTTLIKEAQEVVKEIIK